MLSVVGAMRYVPYTVYMTEGQGGGGDKGGKSVNILLCLIASQEENKEKDAHAGILCILSLVLMLSSQFHDILTCVGRLGRENIPQFVIRCVPKTKKLGVLIRK